MIGPQTLVLPEILYLLTSIYPFLSLGPWGGMEPCPMVQRSSEISLALTPWGHMWLLIP